MGKRGRSKGSRWALVGGLMAGGAVVIPLLPMLKRRAMQPATILKKDHRVVSGLIMTLEMTPRVNERVRKTLFDQIHKQVMVHAQAEEEVLYPALKHVMRGGEEGKISEAYREHQIVKDLLNDMSTMETTSDAFDAKLAQLKRNIQHHVEEEENEMFVLMRQRLSDEELSELGKKLHGRKRDLKARLAA